MYIDIDIDITITHVCIVVKHLVDMCKYVLSFLT